jgi:hypothetical protein
LALPRTVGQADSSSSASGLSAGIPIHKVPPRDSWRAPIVGVRPAPRTIHS